MDLSGDLLRELAKSGLPVVTPGTATEGQGAGMDVGVHLVEAAAALHGDGERKFPQALTHSERPAKPGHSCLRCDGLSSTLPGSSLIIGQSPCPVDSETRLSNSCAPLVEFDKVPWTGAARRYFTRVLHGSFAKSIPRRSVLRLNHWKHQGKEFPAMSKPRRRRKIGSKKRKARRDRRKR